MSSGPVATAGEAAPASSATPAGGDMPAAAAHPYMRPQSHTAGLPTALPPKTGGCVWTNEAVTLLLSLYLREQQLARPHKLKKKDVWRGICAELWRHGLACSWQECDKKYRNLKQTFVRNLKQAGKKECRWMFFPLMLEINRHEPFVGDAMLTAGTETGAANGGHQRRQHQPHTQEQRQQHDDDAEAAAEAEADDKRNGDEHLLVGSLCTPAPSPIAMNLSQRQAPPLHQPPSPHPASLPIDYDAPAPSKRPRRDSHQQQQQQQQHNHQQDHHPHNGLTANGTANQHGQPQTIIKIESPTLLLPVRPPSQSHPHHQAHPHIPVTQTAPIKLSASPLPAGLEPAEPPSPFDRALGSLDIRLLQAAMPFVTHGFAPAHHHMPQHLHQTLVPVAVAPVKTVPTSPSTMVSTDDDGDGDGDDDDDDLRHQHHEQEQKPLADGVGGLIVDEDETRSLLDLQTGNGNPDPEEDQQQQQQPPKWFHMFMAEFRRHEQRKLQQIAELCAEVRRTNDIEQQRNHILSEKNEILRHMNAYMVNK